MNEWTAEECEELIATSVEAIKSSWDLLSAVLSCAYRNRFWSTDGSWKAYCDRTMGLDRELPKAVRDLFLASIVEGGVSVRDAAVAGATSKTTAARAADFFAQKSGDRQDEQAEPEISDEQRDWQQLTEVVKGVLVANQKLLAYAPTTKGAARQLRTELELLVSFAQSKIAWIDAKEDSLLDDSDEIAPRRGTMFSYGADGRFYQR